MASMKVVRTGWIVALACLSCSVACAWQAPIRTVGYKYNPAGVVKRVVVLTFNFTPNECQLMHSQFGYNTQVAAMHVVPTMLKEMGLPGSLTGKVANTVAIAPMIAKTAFDLWAHSLPVPQGHGYSVHYTMYLDDLHQMQGLLGGLGDEFAPTGGFITSRLISMLNQFANSCAR